MNENLKDILSNLNPGVNQETLLLYLQGKLSAEQQHELEKQLVDSDFESDAVEGLDEVKDRQNLMLYVEQLNRELKKKTEKKKRLKKKRELKFDYWIVVLLIMILFLAIISYFLIYKTATP